MASLTHVCMWTKNGWTRISAEDAAKLHPGGTVSANSGLFMCELCGQYVTLTDGDIRVRYFKHSAYEKSKSCPERTFGFSYQTYYRSQEHDLPIRLTEISGTSFRFEIGLIRAPVESADKNLRIEIKPKGSDILYVFSKERLNWNSITYLPIGERPFERYIINLQNGKNTLYNFWPSEIKGMDPEGTLFEKNSGKKLTYDSDVEIEKEYYLLKRGPLIRPPLNGINIKKVTQKRFGFEVWNLYEISAPSFNEDAARFFLDFHCRLTEHPITLQPIWPLFIEGDYLIKHNNSYMYMLVTGNAETVKTFPDAAIRRLSYNSGKHQVYKVNCSERQQLISAGRIQALQYTYFWKEPLNHAGATPNLLVTDLSGSKIAPGESNSLPYNKTLRFKSAFDGELIVLNNDFIVEKRKILADTYLEQEKLSYGSSVQVFIGLDLIWEITFRKLKPLISNDDTKLFQQITSISGIAIPVPHSLHNILVGMSPYPKICQWIRTCIKRGTINEQAYRRLQSIYRRLDAKR